MNLTLRILGAEVLHVSTEAEAAGDGPRDVTTYPVTAPDTEMFMGFTNGREDEG